MRPSMSRLSLVLSCLALLVAGAALAIALGNSRGEPQRFSLSMIPNDGITGAKVDEKTLDAVPRAEAARSAQDARNLRGSSPKDFVASDRLRANRKLVRLSRGDASVLMRGPGYRLAASCAQGKGGKGSRLDLRAHSKLRGSVVTFAGRALPRFGGGRSRAFASLDTGRQVWLGGSTITIASPKGPAVAGIVSLGVNAFGSDCVANLVAIG
jgi:hypothetical protein